MKIGFISWQVTIVMVLLPCILESSPIEKMDAYFEGNKGECYYWHALHHPNTPPISESDLVFLLSKSGGQNDDAAISSRDIAAALFLARDQGIEMSPDLLMQNLDALTLTEGYNRELRLVTELSLTLASLGPEARDAMYPLRNSADQVVAKGTEEGVITLPLWSIQFTFRINRTTTKLASAINR